MDIQEIRQSFLDHFEHGLGYFKYDETLNLIQLAHLLPTQEIENCVEAFDFRYKIIDCDLLTQQLRYITQSKTCLIYLDHGFYLISIGLLEYQLIKIVLNTLLQWKFKCTLISKYSSHLPIIFQPDYRFSFAECEELFAYSIESSIDEYAKHYGFEYNYAALYQRLLKCDQTGYSPLLNLNNWKYRGNPPFSIRGRPAENLGSTPLPVFISDRPGFHLF